MIPIQELRVGVYTDCGGELLRFELVDFADILDGNFHESDYHAIPLTPEILEKAGFEYRILTDWPGWYSKPVNGHSMRVWAEGVDAFCYSVSEYHTVNLNSLHQLQNLHYALFQTELTIQL